MRTIACSLVYHVGLINTEKKNKGSYEGSGLSVSTVPKAWREIVRLGDSPTRVLYNPTGKFLDFYSLTALEKKEIMQWGYNKKLIEPTTIYYIRYYDDEDETEYEMVFTDKEDGEENAEAYEVPLLERTGIMGTLSLSKVSDSNTISKDNHALEQLIIYYFETHAEYDGVWWNEKLDVSSLSAPRAVIFNNKLASWRIYPHMSEYVAHLMLANDKDLIKIDQYHQRRNARLSEIKSANRLAQHNLFIEKFNGGRWVMVGYNQLAVGTADGFELYKHPSTTYNAMLTILQKLKAENLYDCVLTQRLR